MQDEPYEEEKPKRGLDDEPIYGVPMDDYQGPRRRRRWPFVLVVGCLGLCCLCCVLPIAAVAVGAATLSSIMESATVTATQTFDVPEGEPVTLIVDNPVGDITVRQGASDQVEVTYTKKVYGLSQSSAERRLDDLQLSITQPEDSTIRVVAENVDKIDELSEVLSIGSQIRLTITVPEHVVLDISTNVSDITVEDVRADTLHLETNTGDITFDGSLTGAGDQRPSRIVTNVGEITVSLPRDAAVVLSARTDVGDVTVSDLFDRVERTNSPRDDVSDEWIGTLGPEGDRPTLDVETNTGEIRIVTR